MVHVRFINDQETVVTVPVRPDVDRWVLAVMPVKIKLELLRDTLGEWWPRHRRCVYST